MELVADRVAEGDERADDEGSPPSAGKSAQIHSAARMKYSLKWAITRVNAGSSGPTLCCAEK